MKRILILGGGFGGLVTAEKLSGMIGDEHQITLVSPNRTFTFYPALVRYAFGELEAKDITFDLEKKLHELDVRFIQGEVLHLKPELNRVQIAGKEFNGDISYDYLVIAMGRRLATEKMPGFFDYAHHLLGIKAAEKFGQAINEFDEGDIVVGASPNAFLPVPVCETAFLIANKFKTKISKKQTSVTVVFPKTIKEMFGGAEKISEELKETFEKHNINVLEDFPVSKVTKDKVLSTSGHEIPYNLLMLIPPFHGQARLSENRITDKSGFVEVDEYLQIKNMKNAYAVGDIISFTGPKLAHIAVGQAQFVAENIQLAVEGKDPEAIYYHEIAAIIDQGGADSIYLHYGVPDENIYLLKKGSIWGLIKRIHDKLWVTKHRKVWFEKGL